MWVQPVLLCGALIAGAPSVASATSSDQAFEVFQQTCIGLTTHSDDTPFSRLRRVDAQTTRDLLPVIGGEPERSVLWETPSPDYMLFTFDGEDAFCQMFGVRVEFAALQQAFAAWRAGEGAGFRSNGRPFELREVTGFPDQHRAGAWLAKRLGDGQVLQLSVQYRREMFDGLALITLIRLPGLSPAARELYPEVAQ